MESIYEFSSLGRPIDPKYVTNRAILILSFVAGIVTGLAYLITETDLIGAVQGAFFAVAATILGWMITRELDPDHQVSAFISAGIALGASWFIGGSHIIVVYTVLLLVRMVSRSVGPSLKSIDSVIVFVSMVIITLLGYWSVALIGVLAFALDARLENPSQKHIVAAMATSSVAVLGAIFSDRVVIPSSEILIIAGVISVIYLVVLLTLKQVTSSPDVGEGTLSLDRVKWAMAIGLFGAWAALWHGDVGFVATAPLWWSLLATGLYGLMYSIVPHQQAHAETSRSEARAKV